MRPEFRSPINDDLPILANNKPNVQEPIQDQETTMDNSGLNLTPDFEENKESTSEPKVNDLDEMTLGALLNTMNLSKTINHDREIEPPSNRIKSRGPSNATIIFLIILTLLGIGFFAYNLVKPKDAKKEEKNSSSDTISSSSIVSKRKYADNDATAYLDKIVTTVSNKIFMFDTTMLPPATPAYRNQNVYLYIDFNQNLKVMIAKEQTAVTERVVGYPVANFDHLVANLLTIPNPCDATTPSIYILTTLGELYFLDLGKMKENNTLADVYTGIKTATSKTTINLEILKVTSPGPVTSFTTLKEIQTGCVLYPYVLLNNNEMRKVNYNENDNTYSVDQRYLGQIDYLSREGGTIDYYIYIDKTVSNAEGDIISDANGQDFKFEKIMMLYDGSEFNDLNSPYVFISTDNKMITVDGSNLLKINVSEQNVNEIVPNPILEQDGATEILSYVINFADGATVELISEVSGVKLLSIQELIDTPTN